MAAALALGLAALFCVVRAIVDLVARRWWWGVAGLAAGLAIASVPLPTHAVKIDLPATGAAR